LFKQNMLRAFSFAMASAGNNIAARMEIIARTTNSSTRVNAREIQFPPLSGSDLAATPRAPAPPMNRSNGRQVLDCASPLALSRPVRARKSGRGLPYLFSAPTKNSPGARDLSRRNAGKADPRLEISRLLRRPIFLRTKVRAPFARPANTLNTYGSKLPHCSIRWRALHYPEASDLAKRME